MARKIRFHALIAALALAAAASPTLAQSSPLLSTCDTAPVAPACAAVRGDRAEGWTVQSRAEVMAPHGMVTTSQPLAAQAGLQIMRDGGNAIDAAVATAAMLNLVEPNSTGVAADMFAVIYMAKDKKVYTLNASGMAPSGATLARLQALGYRWNPNNWGPGSGMPPFGILTVTVPGAAWGWDEVLRRFGTKSLKAVLQPAIDYAEGGFPISQRIAHDWHLPFALPLEKLLQRTRSGFREDVLYRRQAAGGRADFPQSRPCKDLPAAGGTRTRCLL